MCDYKKWVNKHLTDNTGLLDIAIQIYDEMLVLHVYVCVNVLCV